jgi:cellobiose phosphorylase
MTELVLLSNASDDLHSQFEALIQGGAAAGLADKAGGVFLRRAADLSTEEATLLEAAARVILRDSDGTLAEQLRRVAAAGQVDEGVGRNGSPHRTGWTDNSEHSFASAVGDASKAAGEGLLFDNGVGGFTSDGREYVISLRGGERPPAPWSNVLANPGFRLPGDRGRRWLHMGRQQSNEPPHALE